MEVFIKTLLSNLNVTKREFKVLSNNFYKRLEQGGDLTLVIGEAYMAGEWRSKDLASFFRKVMTIENYNKHLFSMIITKPMTTIKILGNIILNDLLTQAVDILQNNQSIKLSKIVGEQHYDIPDILYEHMLDGQRQYTCAYWKPGTKTLEEAQENKINLLIDKLQIPNNDVVMNILEVGCGWGGLANAISKRHPNCNVVGISISKEQIKYANDKYGSKKLKYIFCDYRDLPNKHKKYDRVISIGCLEHIGVKNFDTFFNCCESALTDEGIFLLHNITNPTQPTYITGSERNTMNKWIDKYIFPGSCIPTVESMLTSSDRQGLMYHHIQNLSISYAKTLKEWYNNFKTNWDVIRKSDPVFFTKEFYNMWEFYLISCSIGFEKKQMGLTQIVFTKKMYKGMYIFTEKEIAI